MTTAVDQSVRTFADLRARRRRGDDDGPAAILALANATDVISFAGGFPDPGTFPGDEFAEVLGEVLREGSAPLQYAPTRGLPGPLDAVGARLGRLDGRRTAAGGG